MNGVLSAKSEGWPRAKGDWWHLDIKDMSYYYKLRFGWNSNGKGRLEISYSHNPKVNDANLESDYFSKVSKFNHCSNPGSIGVLQP